MSKSVLVMLSLPAIGTILVGLILDNELTMMVGVCLMTTLIVVVLGVDTYIGVKQSNNRKR